jgi:hypothetical protein
VSVSQLSKPATHSVDRATSLVNRGVFATSIPIALQLESWTR